MNDLGKISLCYLMTFDRRSRHSPSRIWSAITDSDEVSRWMGYPARIDLRIGGEYFVDFERSGAGGLDGVIAQVECRRRLQYSWGLSSICWELEEEDGGRRYRFVHFGQEPRDVPDEEGLAAGWHAWLEDLELYLDGGAPTHELNSPRWIELKRQYRPLLETALGDALTPHE